MTMTKVALALILALSGCGFEIEKRGYVVRQVSVDAAPGMISATLVLDNKYYPESGASCIGIEVCNSVE